MMYCKRFCFVALAAVAFAAVQAGSVLAAGHVTATLDVGYLEIVGDEADNEIAVYPDEFGAVWVVGRGNTIINDGEPFSFVPGPSFEVVIDLGDGDDAVDVRLATAPARLLYISTGEGDDKVVVKGGEFGPVSVTTRGGDDEVKIEDLIASSLWLSTGEGNDDVVLRNMDTNFLDSRTRIDTRSGNDQVVLDSIVAYRFTLYTWEGNDVVELRGNSATYDSSITLGDGRDVLDADAGEGESWVGHVLTVLGEKGGDKLINPAYFQIVPGGHPEWLGIYGFEVVVIDD